MQTDGLSTTGFLEGASEKLRKMLIAQAREINLEPGDVLFEQGDDGDSIFAISEGAIEVSILSASGRKLSLDMMRDGAIFGEIALFDPGPRTATVTAVEPSKLRCVRYGDVLEQIRQHPDLAVDMIRLAGQRMRWMGTQLNEQVFLPMPTRLARKILYLVPEDGETLLSLSQSELAEFVGATREAVSKTISSWKRADIIEVSRGGLTILDRDALKLLAEPDMI